MGKINCSICNVNDEKKDEIESNIKSLDYLKNGNLKYSLTDNTNLGLDVIDLPFSEYSFALFEKFNSLRTEPLKFYAESNKYNLSKIIKELIEKRDKLSLKLTWSSKKERIISNIMMDNSFNNIKEKLEQIKNTFQKEFEINIYYARGTVNRIDDALWNVLVNLQKKNEDKLKNILMKKIDYCVIFSINENDLKNDSNNNKETNESKIIDTKIVRVISFFFFFNYHNK